MNMVTSWISEINFSVLNDRVVPIREVKRAVWSYAHINRSKRDMV